MRGRWDKQYGWVYMHTCPKLLLCGYCFDTYSKTFKACLVLKARQLQHSRRGHKGAEGDACPEADLLACALHPRSCPSATIRARALFSEALPVLEAMQVLQPADGPLPPKAAAVERRTVPYSPPVPTLLPWPLRLERWT